ncbi:hypothetical protein FJY84_00115 [Candidatus Bathyarchaeota archaeon]|nr:hypothetical protein [Candidatus Bathyarchaeota archaeon]
MYLKSVLKWILFFCLLFSNLNILKIDQVSGENKIVDSPLLWSLYSDNPNDVCISSDGKIIVVCTGQGFKIFKDILKTPSWDYNFNSQLVSTSLSLDGNFMVCGVDPGILYLFNINTPKPLWSCKLDSRIAEVSIDRNGENIVVTTQKKIDGLTAKIYLFSRNSNAPIWFFELDAAGSMYRPVAISADGKYIIAGGDSIPCLHLFTPSTNIPLWIYEPNYTPWLSAVAISEDGSYIVAANNQAGAIQCFSKDNNKPLWTYFSGQDIYQIAMSVDGEYIVAGGIKSTLYLFSKKDGLIWSYKVGGSINSVSISGDGKYIVVGSQDNHIYLLSREDKTPIWSYRTNGGVFSTAISSNGDYIIVESRDKYVYFFKTLINGERKSTTFKINSPKLELNNSEPILLHFKLTSQNKPISDKLITWDSEDGEFEYECGFTDSNGEVSIMYTTPIIDNQSKISITANFAGDEFYYPTNNNLSLIINSLTTWKLHPTIKIKGDLEFTLDKGVIGGSGVKEDPFIIEGWEINSEKNCGIFIENTNKYVIIRNMHIFGEYSSSPTNCIQLGNVQNIVIENSVFEKSSNFGIYIDTASNINVNHNVIRNNARQGISVLKASYITISDNIINNNGDLGFESFFTSNGLIINNVVNSNSKHGIGIYYTNYTKISNNTAFCNGWTGVSISYDSNNNLLTDTNIQKNGLCPWSVGGIQLKENSNNNVIKNNDIENNLTFGINVINKSVNTTIENNKISNNNALAINLILINNAIIKNNVISNNEQIGIALWDSYENKIINNTIKENKQGGLFFSQSFDNIIYKNNFINNQPQLCNSEISNNELKLGGEGNYWNDYKGNDLNFDGIGDTSYQNLDPYPFINENGWLTQFNLTVKTNFPLIPFKIENLAYNTENNGIKTINLGYIKSYKISFPEEIKATDNTRLKFRKWEDSSINSTRIINISSHTTIQASYVEQAHVNVVSQYGEVSGGGWYDVGSETTITLKQTIISNNMTKAVFSGWAGNYSSSNPTITFIVSDPVNLEASFMKQYYLKVESEFSQTLGSGWYNEGTKASYSIQETKLSSNLFISKVFKGWSGDSASVSQTNVIVVDKPITIKAIWVDDFTAIYIIGGAFLAIILVLFLIKRK